jgi:hypothetical protein
LYIGMSKKELSTICKALQQYYGTKINWLWIDYRKLW